MRIGINPTKGGKLIERETCHHRIIIPVHIPHENDYFKDSYRIFELCLFSILKTSHSKIKISIISNNCNETVNQRLLELYNQKLFDELIIEREGIGKINSILKALRTVEERLITITDADVLFDNGWEDAVAKVFTSFPKAGAVCPVPVFRKHFDLTSTIWLPNLFSNKLKFLPVKNPEAMTLFAKSLGWEWLEKEFQDVIGTIEATDGTIAVLGCSHFAATYKREVFEQLPKENSIYKTEGNSEFLYTDEPVLKMGGYRLSTYDNHAFHLGNTFEPWMQEKFDSLVDVQKRLEDYTRLPVLSKSSLYLVKEKVFKRLLKIDKFKRNLYLRKGLSKEQVHNFIDKKYV